PVRDCLAQSWTPAPHSVNECDELEQVRNPYALLVALRPTHTRASLHSRSSRQRQRVQRWVILWCTAGNRDVNDHLYGALAVFGDCGTHVGHILLGQIGFGDIVRATLAAKQQPALETDPSVRG